jgi:hypothetical protein
MFKNLIILSLFSAVAAFSSIKSNKFSTSLHAKKSASVPFLPQPASLDGTLPGDVGFDPLGLSTAFGDKDWSQQVVPDNWLDSPRTPIKTVEWMREAEVKHCRLAMLAVVGWVAVDYGLRLPGDSFAAIPNSLEAHKLAVENGSMG